MRDINPSSIFPITPSRAPSILSPFPSAFYVLSKVASSAENLYSPQISRPIEAILDEYTADQKLMVESRQDCKKNPRCPR